MGVMVSRAEVADVEKLRAKARDALEAKSLRSWRVGDGAVVQYDAEAEGEG